ncbi:5-formyltetrahydrofolate cyclo-ligase [Vineibacter terrae]|uniref:5-formyltetrahydrofolate cyclo-ligase n=1 Tax=Vineibacter terrae TaxID=2586908 RepID=A0A5C8PA29_9HYPH|nr:5-formyltetrahydrofolate cyclo-ligase [Vineibacter terrae]TXL70399.1 5-formyltetrahydrofolate cyclo-ligase [Vineibacter terrae]
MTVEEDKKALRSAMHARRAAVAAADRAAAGAALAATWRREQPVLTPHPDGRATVVAGFWPMGEEIDLRPLLGALHDDGYAVGLPVTPAAAAPLRFRQWTPGTLLVGGPFGTSEPAAAAPEVEPDALLVPFLAVDADGYRLGYGGGYYDRTLLELRARRRVIAIGVGFEAQRVDRVPRGPHDDRLDWLLTDRRLLAFA